MIKTAFPPISSPVSKILLLGTMPGEQSLKLQQYYGNKANHFWKIIFSLFNQPFSDDYAIKKQLLLTHNIALWDVLQYCEREGSSDNKIKNEVPNDFEKFYAEHPLINHVFFASAKAQAYYDIYVKRKSNLNYHVLPSPSRANTWKTFDEKLVEWKVILESIA